MITDNSVEFLVKRSFLNSIFAEKTLSNELKTGSSSSMSFFHIDINFQIPIIESNSIPLPCSLAILSSSLSFSLSGSLPEAFLNNYSLLELRKNGDFLLLLDTKKRSGIAAITNTASINRNLDIFISRSQVKMCIKQLFLYKPLIGFA